MEMTFHCGHRGEAPQFMGRGKARERRLADYFDRVCCACAIERRISLLQSLTAPDGTPRPASAERIGQAVDQVKRRY